MLIRINPQAGDNTQQFINARDSAGQFGQVLITTGEYSITPVSLNVTGQKWECEPGVTIKRQQGFGGSTVKLEAQEVQFIGGTVDNSLEPSVGSGVEITGKDCTLKNSGVLSAAIYGVYSSGENANIAGNKIINTGQISIFCQTSVQAKGPRITDNLVDRSALGLVPGGGGIYVRGVSTGRWLDPYVSGNRVMLPSTSPDTAIGVEVWFSNRPIVSNNALTGGYMSVSFGNTNYGVVSGNTCHDNSCYGIEFAQNTCDCVADGNIIDGSGKATYGVICSALGVPSNRNVISNNSISNVAGPGVGSLNSYDTLVNGNKLVANTEGVYLQSSEYSAVTGNLIIGNGYGTGVRIESPVNTLVQGNSIRSFAQGVRYESSANVLLTGNLMQGNTLSGGISSPLVLAISPPASWSGHNRIVGNTGFYRNGRSADTLDVLNDCCVVWGGGVPEGQVSAGPGSTYHSIDGTVWNKATGYSTAGWVQT